MYFPYFITYMSIGFLISLVALFWSLNTGQFKDQQRARFIPLEAVIRLNRSGSSRWARVETIALFTFVCLGLTASAAVRNVCY